MCVGFPAMRGVPVRMGEVVAYYMVNGAARSVYSYDPVYLSMMDDGSVTCCAVHGSRRRKNKLDE